MYSPKAGGLFPPVFHFLESLNSQQSISATCSGNQFHFSEKKPVSESTVFLVLRGALTVRLLLEDFCCSINPTALERKKIVCDTYILFSN